MEFLIGTELKLLSGPVMVTGHTGFKGTWLTLFLEKLGVPVVGYSLEPSNDSLFVKLGRVGKIVESFQDIRDSKSLERFMEVQKPSVVLHMAAQSLVLNSYQSPKETFEINSQGTVNVLDSAFRQHGIKVVAVVTTDKVYKNENTGRKFIESDPLAGKDPYSASKVASEAAVAAWQQISKISGGPKVIALRAGNVIGGGDWAKNRLIPDLAMSYISKKEIEVRNPYSTRPWQHVLDPLCGYLMAIENCLKNGGADSYNFSPKEESISVIGLIETLEKTWNSDFTYKLLTETCEIEKEAKTLQLNSSLATIKLGWDPVFSQIEAIERTGVWWEQIKQGTQTYHQAVSSDIDFFLSQIQKRIKK